MSSYTEILPDPAQNLMENNNIFRKVYHKPHLEELGDLRAVTLSGSIIAPSDTGTSNRNFQGG